MNYTNDKSYSDLITPPTTTILSPLTDELNDSVTKYAKEENGYNLSNSHTVAISQQIDRELIKLIKPN